MTFDKVLNDDLIRVAQLRQAREMAEGMQHSAVLVKSIEGEISSTMEGIKLMCAKYQREGKF
jgi:hypothetical protein